MSTFFNLNEISTTETWLGKIKTNRDERILGKKVEKQEFSYCTVSRLGFLGKKKNSAR